MICQLVPKIGRRPVDLDTVDIVLGKQGGKDDKPINTHLFLWSNFQRSELKQLGLDGRAIFRGINRRVWSNPIKAKEMICDGRVFTLVVVVTCKHKQWKISPHLSPCALSITSGNLSEDYVLHRVLGRLVVHLCLVLSAR